METAYRLASSDVATYAGAFYVCGRYLGFWDTPDGRSFSENRLRAMLATGEAEPARADCAAGRRLHVDLGRAGVKDHYAFASRVLGRPVEHLRYLSAGERNAVRGALRMHTAGVEVA